MKKSNGGVTGQPVVKSGPPQLPPTPAQPTKMRYNMASEGMGQPGKVAPWGSANLGRPK